jgi:hypothetical protein
MATKKTSKPPDKVPTTATGEPKAFSMPRLGDCFIASCEYESGPALSKFVDSELGFATRIVISEPRTRLITVGVVLTPDSRAELGEILEVVGALALHDFDDDVPEEAITQHALMLGAPIVYGAIRDFVANLTARSPFGLVQLPLVATRLLVTDVDVIDLTKESPPEQEG